MHCAAYHGNKEILEFLLTIPKLKAKINNKAYMQNKESASVLGFALDSKFCKIATIDCLLKNGAKVTNIDNSGGSALHLAA
jgi:ankyrin repeat protein